MRKASMRRYGEKVLDRMARGHDRLANTMAERDRRRNSSSDVPTGSSSSSVSHDGYGSDILVGGLSQDERLVRYGIESVYESLAKISNYFGVGEIQNRYFDQYEGQNRTLAYKHARNLLAIMVRTGKKFKDFGVPEEAKEKIRGQIQSLKERAFKLGDGRRAIELRQEQIELENLLQQVGASELFAEKPQDDNRSWRE
jgi:hypothetical protein